MWLRALGTPATNLPASKGGVAVCRWLIRNDWRRRNYTISPPSRFKMEISMAKSNIRRTIIREWTSLAREKRQSRQQALAFTKAAVERHHLPRSRRTPEDIIMTWLLPRTGRP